MTKTELSKLEKSKKVQYVYIFKNGFYYRPNAAGYTEHRHKAGVYTKEDGIKSASRCTDIDLIPIDISKHNEMLLEEAQDLLSRRLSASAGNGA